MLKKLGLKRINTDDSIFVTSLGINGPIVSTFVDNIKIMQVKRLHDIKKIKRELVTGFEMVDMGLVSFYLGLKVERDHLKKMPKLFQLTYINRILSKYHLNLAKPCNTLMKKVIFLLNKRLEAKQAEQK